jgi:hypothetical protein
LGILGRGTPVAIHAAIGARCFSNPLPCFRINNGCPFRVAWEATRLDAFRAVFLSGDMAPSIVDVKSWRVTSPWTLSWFKKSCRLARFLRAPPPEDRVGSCTT